MYIKKKDRKFYIFEDAAILSLIGMSPRDNYLSESEIVSLVQRISRSYKMNAPEIKYTRIDSGTCYYRRLDNTIYLNKRYGCTLLFILHEMCHAVCYKLYPDHTEAHGKEFVTVWIEIMARMFDVEAREFRNLAQQSKVDFIV
jgi:predicted SprT family Zn-dependent metalloprotease